MLEEPEWNVNKSANNWANKYIKVLEEPEWNVNLQNACIVDLKLVC